MVHGPFAWSVLAFACLPLAYYVVTLETAVRYAGITRPSGRPDLGPPVSILKPVRGLDRHTVDHFVSLCRQDYPEYEILFAVADDTDPAIPVIRRLADDFPDRSIRLIVGVPALGPSSKVSKLCRLVREARHEVLVISDSDITVPQDYLRAVVAPFANREVGAVTCLYRGVSEGGLWADLEALGISTEFAPGVLVARRFEGMKFTLGATMATTRARLSEIGGFEALVECCADDFELGHRIAARGHRIELARCSVATECAPAGFVEFFRHELRWAITLRHSRPWGYAGRMAVTQGLPWSVAVASVVAPPAAGIYFLTFLTLRLAVAWAVGVRILDDDTVKLRWWLVPLRDAVTFFVSIASLCSNRIDWRGQSFELQRGRLVPISAGSRTSRKPAE